MLFNDLYFDWFDERLSDLLIQKRFIDYNHDCNLFLGNTHLYPAGGFYPPMEVFVTGNPVKGCPTNFTQDENHVLF